MDRGFYQSQEYKQKQSLITRQNWLLGKYSLLRKSLQERVCKNSECGTVFLVKPSNPKLYCSSSCAAVDHNSGRSQSIKTRAKISLSMQQNDNGKGNRVPFVELKCQCKSCQKSFFVSPYLASQRKYCSRICAIRTIGKQTTSPKASKGKSGIRSDIDQNIIFYSTWEANIARTFNLIGLRWKYSPDIFDLGRHTYRPDFYLPEHKIYIEVKNFMSDYATERDQLFRRRYPHLKLEIISKKEYLEIKQNYSKLIENWE